MSVTSAGTVGKMRSEVEKVERVESQTLKRMVEHFFYWLKDMGQKFGHIILCIFMFTTFFALYKDNEDIKYEQNRQSDAAKKNIN